jgi:multidrug resistance efflux pump
MSIQSGNHHPAQSEASSLSDRVRSLRLRTEGPAAAPRSAWLPWGVALIAVVLAAAMGVRAYLVAPSGDVVNSDEGSGKSDSKAFSDSYDSGASHATGEVVLDGRGNIIAEHQIQLSPQVGGEIIWLDPRFKEGAVYKKGERLAEIDPEIYKAQLASAEAILNVSRVNLQQVENGSSLQEILMAKAQLRNLGAKVDLAEIDERNKRRAGAATTRDEMEKATVQLVMDKASFEAQKETVNKMETSLKEQRLVNRAQVQKAEADVAQAKKQLKNCTIVAPTTGMILTKKAEQGGYVNPLAYSGVAGYLCEMADLTELEVELDIPERDIGQIKPGQRCRIMPDAAKRDQDFNNTHPNGYSGYFSRRMPVANRSKAAITVRVKIEIPEGEEGGKYLSPDMGAMVWFLK